MGRDVERGEGSQDTRVSNTVTKIVDILTEVLEDRDVVTSSNVVLPTFHQHPLYVVDIFIDTSNIAVIVVPAEHFDSSGEILLGRQAMRVRHLRTMGGYKVMC